MARLTAARGFLLAEWLGALLMVASFTQLYVVVFGGLGSGRLALGVGAALLALGSLLFLRSRRHYRSIGVPVAAKWHGAAAVVAGSAVIFWLLFLLLALLVALGVEVT